jgi:hypothetical protein
MGHGSTAPALVLCFWSSSTEMLPSEPLEPSLDVRPAAVIATPKSDSQKSVYTDIIIFDHIYIYIRIFTYIDINTIYIYTIYIYITLHYMTLDYITLNYITLH